MVKAMSTQFVISSTLAIEEMMTTKSYLQQRVLESETSVRLFLSRTSIKTDDRVRIGQKVKEKFTMSSFSSKCILREETPASN